jgi:thioredoxin 1
VSSRELSRADIDELTGPLLLEFGASWCPHCLVMRPVVAGLLRSHPEVRHIRVADEPGRPLGRSFRVKLWPNFVLMRSGKVLRQLARPAPGELEEAMREAFPLAG